MSSVEAGALRLCDRVFGDSFACLDCALVEDDVEFGFFGGMLDTTDKIADKAL